MFGGKCQRRVLQQRVEQSESEEEQQEKYPTAALTTITIVSSYTQTSWRQSGVKRNNAGLLRSRITEAARLLTAPSNDSCCGATRCVKQRLNVSLVLPGSEVV